MTRSDYTSRNTPWGYSQYTHEVVDGITRVSTASHGGFILDEQKENEVKRLFPDFQPYAGAGFYEEDCDWAVVVITHPVWFKVEDVYQAVEMVRMCAQHLSDDRWKPVVEFIDSSDTSQAHYLRATHAEVRDSARWQVGSQSTSGHGWNVSLVRTSDGARQSVYMKECNQDFYTDEELSLLSCSDSGRGGTNADRSSSLAVATV